MKSRNASFIVIFLTFGLGLGTAVVPAAGTGRYQAYPAPYTDLRGLVDRTQSDLRLAADLEHGNDKQRDRYRSAQGHLSTFDRHLTKGHFDKDELNKSIDAIKDILDHNVLQASSRDALMRDVEDLRIARDRS
jgi:hypothetical protein